ncbi:MAG: AAA family ATPase [Syntrophobacterales bacterium]|nr:MAG: AAA family ATPase [Syntrophobacterales bacterium]
MEHQRKILALTSSKGGVGKTHVAVSLSAAIAKRNARVLLIDADLGNGTVSDRIGFYPKFNLAHFFLKEKDLGDLIEETPFGFFLIGGERGNFALANLNYLQKMKFLRSFIKVSRNFDFVVLDLASGINRQAVDFALLAEKTIVVTSPNDLISAYGSVRACFSRFRQLEIGLSKRIEGYKARRFFSPLVLMNKVADFNQGKSSFEALESAVENRLNGAISPFGIKMNYLGAVFHDLELFKKSEERQRPVSVVSVYSKVAFCIDLIASAICSPSSFGGFDGEKRLRYTIHILMEQQERLRKVLTQKVMKISPVRFPFRQRNQSISH